MKIANNHLPPSCAGAHGLPTARLLAMAACALFAALSHACADPLPMASGSPAVPPMASSPAMMPAATPSTPSPSSASPSFAPAASAAPINPATPEAAKPAGADMAKSVTAMEDKISDSAKGLVKKLDNSSDEMTLEDMNAARQTVARLEAMIDIEKHLTELEKARKDRTGEGTGSSLANAIPASALTPHLPMPPFAAMPAASPVSEQPVRRAMPSMSSLEISRIIGTDGRYSALLKLPNGDLKSVRVGDQVESGVTVQAIASSSVVLDENGKTRTLHIKNVDVIFSAMR